MATMSQSLPLRRAERIPLPQPIPGVIAGENARIVELSLVGAGVEHTARIALNSTVPLDFVWRGEHVVLQATIARSELRVVKGANLYYSGVTFCAAIFDSPPAIRKIIRSAVENVFPPDAWTRHKTDRVAFFRSDDDEGSSAPYLECLLEGGIWRKQPVWVPNQPREGFTMVAPDNDAVTEPLCQHYANSPADVRRLIRASAELSIAQNRKS